LTSCPKARGILITFSECELTFGPSFSCLLHRSSIFNIGLNQTAPLESRYYGPYDRLFNYAVVEGSFT